MYKFANYSECLLVNTGKFLKAKPFVYDFRPNKYMRVVSVELSNMTMFKIERYKPKVSLSRIGRERNGKVNNSSLSLLVTATAFTGTNICLKTIHLINRHCEEDDI